MSAALLRFESKLGRDYRAARERLAADPDLRARWLIRAGRALILEYGLAAHAEVKDPRGLALVLPCWRDFRDGRPFDLVDLLYLDPEPPHAHWWQEGVGSWLGFPEPAPDPDAPAAALRLHATPASWVIGNSMAVHRWQALRTAREAAAIEGLELADRAAPPRFTPAQLALPPIPTDSLGRMWFAAPAGAPWGQMLEHRITRVICDSNAHAAALSRLLKPALRRRLSFEVTAVAHGG